MATSDLSVYYQNCKGLRTKLNSLYMNILAHTYDIIILTETWLINDICDSEFIDQRYTVYRCDRDRTATKKLDGGGVLVAVLKELRTSAVTHTNNYLSQFVEHVLISLPSTQKCKNHIISAVYIPPKTKEDIYESYLKSLQTIINGNDVDLFYIIGDFNLPHLEWVPHSNTKGYTCNGTTSICELLSNFMSLNNAFQYNFLKNSDNRILDLLISNIILNESLPASPELSKIDPLHPPFYNIIALDVDNKPMKKRAVPKYNFHRAKFDLINRDLNLIDWHGLLGQASAEDALDIFYDKIYGIIKTHTPLSKSKSSRFPVWFSPALIHIFNDKNKAWIKWKTYGNLCDYQAFSLYRKRFKSECDKCFTTYIESVESSISTNVKHFWTYIANRRNKSGIPSTMKYDGHSSSDPNTVCNMFSDYFHSVYEPSTIDINKWSLPPCSNNNNVLIHNLHFTEHRVLLELKRLDLVKGAGPDGLPPIFLTRVADKICTPLSIIFNKCITEGVFPTVWKLANITPVHKGGHKNEVGQYRPISIMSTLSKLFERLVHDVIYPILHNALIQEQHGFVRKRSTTTNLILFANNLFEHMDNRIQVDAVYTDFRKAFDKVDHRLLLDKIAYNGIRGDLLRWFASYITNRRQRVLINGFQSNTIVVTSGVPQGSILGPLLFILFINDIKQCFLNSKFLMYADDLKAFKPIYNINDSYLFQEDLNRLSVYCDQNKLKLNLDKCNFITFSKKVTNINFTYSLCGAPLERVDSLRDLGILFDRKLHLDLHIEKIVNKAYQLYGFIMRASHDFHQPSTYLHLYKSLIRPQLEYAVCVWNPLYIKYREIIERVQRKFLRAMHFRCHRGTLSYSRLLVKYKMQTLEDRRTLLEAMTLYGICHNKYDCMDLTNKLCYVIPRTVLRREVRAYQLFSTSHSKTNAGKRAPLCRMVNNYNNFFINIDIFHQSISSFKRNVIDTLS